MCAMVIQFWALHYESEYYISQLLGLLRNVTQKQGASTDYRPERFIVLNRILL
jgi:hypothetical protein